MRIIISKRFFVAISLRNAYALQWFKIVLDDDDAKGLYVVIIITIMMRERGELTMRKLMQGSKGY